MLKPSTRDDAAFGHAVPTVTRRSSPPCGEDARPRLPACAPSGRRQHADRGGRAGAGRNACNGPGARTARRLDQHRPGMRASLFVDPAVLRQLEPGLSHTRIEADIAHQLLRTGKRRTSPMAATSPTATVRLMPVMLNSLSTAELPKPACAIARSSTARSSRRRSSSRRCRMIAACSSSRQRLPLQPGATASSQQIHMRASGNEVSVRSHAPRS